ncbi:hypothetical protein F5Y00DRAFT_115722 [Daldinia vernicosa]|uniref:uncharacterized protein n=1 Tax=Daldinia vernicosa TaxID=114800 RepID=UPI00200894FB|nr:uncharacterized protein F5Y00DRAFT_115722 [Daldinia vernicosa]KAI0847526.1 hypothetical protein F5Y00DRAFT_115722 [Daldinia vernicosa]
MPTYLCHGFRWHRPSIRYFVVIQNVDDVASEWIIARQSPVALLNQFYELFDFLPPCPRPARNLSPSPHRIRNGFPAINGHTYSRTHSCGGQGSKEEVSRFGYNEDGNDSRQSKLSLSGRSKASEQLPTTKQRDKLTLSPASEPPDPNDDIPFNDWSIVKFLEEFDPSDLTTVSGQWAYVADYVVRIDTSISVAEEISRYETRMKMEPYKPMSGMSEEICHKVNTYGNKKAGWFEKLRDQLQRKESIRWYVVVCGDEERIGAELTVNQEAKDGTVKANDSESQPSQGFIEDGFEFRFPELLVPHRAIEQGPRRRRVEKSMTKQSQAPLPDNEQPAISPPASLQVTRKMSIDHAIKHTGSRFSGGLRRLFLRRKADGLT